MKKGKCIERTALTLLVVVVIILSVVAANQSYAAALPELVTVVRGTHNGIWANRLTSGAWVGWSNLGGATTSAPALCGLPGYSNTQWLFVRGTDNRIYYKIYSPSVDSWSFAWHPIPGGATKDRPACAVIASGKVMVVVRGMDDGIYANDLILPYFPPGGWSGWQFLQGYAKSAPTVVANPGVVNPDYYRFDLIVQGMDNGIYHKAWKTGTGWAPKWDTTGGCCSSPKTKDVPAAVTWFEGLSDMVNVVVRGLDDGIYWNQLNIENGNWGSWIPLNGKTSSAPSLSNHLAYPSRYDLVVRGMDDRIYYKQRPYNGVWESGWERPTGYTSNSPAVTFRTAPPWVGEGYTVVVFAGADHGIYCNQRDPWAVWTLWAPAGLTGVTYDPPSIANVGWTGNP